MRIEELKAVRNIQAEIDTKIERLVVLRAKATKITSVLSGMPKGGAETSKIEAAVVRIVEEQKHLEEELKALEEAKRAVEEKIKETVKDSKERNVLELRYLAGLSWRKIMKILHFSKARVFQLHTLALKRLD